MAGGIDPRDGDAPLTVDEIAGVLDRCLPSDADVRIESHMTAVLAVSGGTDSMAMMHVFAEGVRGRPLRHVVAATVDHRLRPESAAEAAFVAAEAAKLGVPHHTLVWDDPKPDTGIQAAARAARYRLLGGLARNLATDGRIAFLATAHTADDQIETFLMRLARGSGVEGLAGIRWHWHLEFAGLNSFGERHVHVLRPFLSIPKRRLIATLQARNATWVEDPSNQDTAFERVRIRRLVKSLVDAEILPEALARSVRRLRKATEAVEAAAVAVLEDPSLVRFDLLGHVEVRSEVFVAVRRFPVAVGERVLAAVLRRAGGDPGFQSLETIEALYARIQPEAATLQDTPLGATLARVKVDRRKEWVRFVREAGRHPPAQLPLQPGVAARWDGRMLVGHDRPERDIVVRMLGRAGFAALADRGLVPKDVASVALRVAPGFWQGETLIAVPGLAARWTATDAGKAAQLSAGCWCRLLPPDALAAELP